MSLVFCNKITNFVTKCSHRRAPATQQLKKKSHHHRKQKIAHAAKALQQNEFISQKSLLLSGF